MTRPLNELHAELGRYLENMIAVQMQFYPSDWPEADKRELAMKHLQMASEGKRA